jgi:hypothetical protein
MNHTYSLPHTLVLHVLNSMCKYHPLMTKKRRSGQQLEKPQFDFKVSETIHEEIDNSELETEIECPLCQSIMTFSAYDSPYYGCDECNFCLYM